MNKDYRAIVVGGAGSNIYAYLGAFDVLFEETDFGSGGAFEKIKTFIGSSAGAIVATILAAGGDMNYIKTQINEIDLSLLADHSYFILANLYRVFSSFGYNKGDALITLIENNLEELTGNKDITLQGLYDYKNRKVNLVVTGCNVSKRQLRYFNRLTDPDMKVSHAVRISTSIPIVFKPFEYQGDLYIDGSILANVPIDFVNTAMFKLLNCYDPEIIGVDVPVEKRVTIQQANRDLYDLVRDDDETSQGFLYIMNRTIGMKTYSPRSLKFINPDDIKDDDFDEDSKITSFNIITFVSELMDTVLNGIEKYHIDDKYWRRMCKINVYTMSSINFNITADDKAKLFEYGKQGAKDFLESNNVITL